MTKRILQALVFALLATTFAVAFTTVRPQNAGKAAVTNNNNNQQRQAKTKWLTVHSMAGPAVLEPKVAEPKTIQKEEQTTKSESTYKRGGWAVRLFNDPMNKREFVAMCLNQIVGLTDGQSYQVMMQAHKNGVAIVGRFDLERAELYKTALIDNGLTCDMIPVDDE